MRNSSASIWPLGWEDEAHFHVPGTGETCQDASDVAAIGRDKKPDDLSEAEGPATNGVERIDLNVATLGQLETLPGIGAVKAQAIIDYRKRNGPFESVEQIMEVSGIGPATYEGIRDLVRVGKTPP